MVIDKKRARVVFSMMLEQYRNRGFPFFGLDTDLPQYYAPKNSDNDPVRLARYYFFLCLYMRGGVDSVLVARKLTAIYETHPDLFDERVLNYTSLEIRIILEKSLPLFSRRIGEFWITNAKILWRYWKGDPRRLFVKAIDSDEIYYRFMGRRYRPMRERIAKQSVNLLPRLDEGTVYDHKAYAGLLGFRKKMTSMLAYFLYEARLIEREPPLSAPIDFHHLRIYLQTGMIIVGKEVVRYEHLVETGVALALYLQKHFKISMSQYGDIVWLWSKVLCSTAPHNRTGKKEQEWDEKNLRAFDRSCGECAISGMCTLAVPSANYYQRGKLHVVPRDRPPGTQMRDIFTFPRIKRRRAR